MCLNYVSTTLTPNERWSWRAGAGWEAPADALRELAGRAIGTLEALLNAQDERVRLAAAAAILKATALHDVRRPSGPTSEAAVHMSWMLAESAGVW